MLSDFWAGLPLWVQDTALLLALLAPAVAIGTVTLRGFDLRPLLVGLLRRHAGLCAVFVLLIAVSVGIGAALIAQERGIRAGTAQAADKFDLIVAAPGSEVTAMLAAVYLQPSDLALLDGATYKSIATHDRVDMAAPIAFGDSWQGAPVVGTIPDFVAHLSDGLSQGRVFADHGEAVAGARVPLSLGQTFTPAHGVGAGAETGAHGDATFEVVGRMPPTGTPWDRALLVPVEAVWEIHGLANGHAPHRADQLGPPFDAAYFPGTPAILVRAEQLWVNYQLRSEFTTDRTMAFFPGTVLAQLHALLGDVRQVMSLLAVVTQVLVAAAVLAGLVMLTRLLVKRLALLRALGAPARFVFALTWSFASTLIAVGAVLGLVVGIGAARVIAAIVTERTDILVRAALGWPELHLVAGFVSATVVLSLLPAWLSIRRAPVADLRG